MQWRSLVVGLVVLRLSLSCLLWLTFGLGPGVSFGFNFHLSFNLHKLDLLFREEKDVESKGKTWSQQIQGKKYEETASTCAQAGQQPKPPRSYLGLFQGRQDEYVRRYSSFPDSLKTKMKDMARDMFYFGYDNYMKYAFPKDELNPIDCEGRGPDVLNPSNININDVLGNYSLTLIDTLDTLLVLGNVSEFQKAVKLVIDTVSFDKDSTVQVFEANIRILGSLISAHILLTDPKHPFGEVSFEDYNNELLHLAHDLAVRLLPAFENTNTGIPYPRVNLKTGVPPDSINETCTAGAGSLLVEFGILSRLIGDSTFEWVARRAVRALWKLRSNETGLLGNVVNIQTGQWVGKQSGLGAGMDSFYEYLLKSYILFGEKEDYRMFQSAYESIQNHMRRGRESCNEGEGDPPLYVNVNMFNGEIMNTWIDSLQAFFPGLQVLNGDVDNAICLHAFYYAIWKRFGALPERYNWHLQAPDVLFYPLRPELVESTYLLYQILSRGSSSDGQIKIYTIMSLNFVSYRQPKILFIYMLVWIFFRVLRRMPKSGVGTPLFTTLSTNQKKIAWRASFSARRANTFICCLMRTTPCTGLIISTSSPQRDMWCPSTSVSGRDSGTTWGPVKIEPCVRQGQSHGSTATPATVTEYQRSGAMLCL